MRFALPLWFSGLAVLPVVILAFALGAWRRQALLRRLAEPHLLAILLGPGGGWRRPVRAALGLAALGLVVIALARPQWGSRAEVVSRQGVDVVVALDASLSMLTEDVAPSRIERARAFVSALARRLEGNRIGLAVFAGTGHVQCPLTLDLAALALFTEAVAPVELPQPGSSLSEGITAALEAFPESGLGGRVIIVVGDGEEHAGGEEDAARLVRARGVLLHTVTVGTEAGGLIPLRAPDGRLTDWKETPEGEPVTSRADPQRMARVAVAGGGRAFALGADLAVVDRLAAEIERLEKGDLSSRVLQTHRERFQLPLTLGILLLGVEACLGSVPRRRSAVAGETP